MIILNKYEVIKPMMKGEQILAEVGEILTVRDNDNRIGGIKWLANKDNKFICDIGSPLEKECCKITEVFQTPNIFIAYVNDFQLEKVWHRFNSYDEVIIYFNTMSLKRCNYIKLEICVIDNIEREDIKTISDLLDFANINNENE